MIKNFKKLLLYSAACVLSCASCNNAQSSLKEKLEGKYLSILGDSISTFEGVSSDTNNNSTIGKDYAYYPNGWYQNKDVKQQGDTYWGMLCNDIGLKMLVNNSVGGSRAVEAQDIRCVNLHADKGLLSGKEPDVAIIYIGINDVGATIETAKEFTSAFKSIVSKMKERYKNTDLFFCTLPFPSTGAYDAIKFATCNSAIKQSAELYGLKDHVIDLFGSEADDASKLTCDGLHPNKAGMIAIYNVIKQFLTNYYIK